jgi:hypothetical protein
MFCVKSYISNLSIAFLSLRRSFDFVTSSCTNLSPSLFFSTSFPPFQVVKETIAQKHPYGEWLAKELFTLKEWDQSAQAQGLKPPGFNLHDTTRRLNLFGYTTVNASIHVWRYVSYKSMCLISFLNE